MSFKLLHFLDDRKLFVGSISKKTTEGIDAILLYRYHCDITSQIGPSAEIFEFFNTLKSLFASDFDMNIDVLVVKFILKLVILTLGFYCILV